MFSFLGTFDPKHLSKISQKMLIFGLNFGSFCWGFWSSLGSSWEPSWVSWGSLGRPPDPKTSKNRRFFEVFENAAFWFFEAPDGSLGLILPPLWPIWFQSGPQNGSQKWSKKWSKSWLKMTPKPIRKFPKSLVQKGFNKQKNRSDRTLFSEIGPSKNAYLKMP